MAPPSETPDRRCGERVFAPLDSSGGDRSIRYGHGPRRLVAFLLGVGALLAGLELLFRVNEPYVLAFSDKLLMKAAILERAPDTRVLFIGTSRFVDGIDQGRFEDEIAALTGQRLKALNGACTGANGERFAYLAELAAANAGLTHVILEASPKAQAPGPLDLPQLSEQEPPDPDAPNPIELALQATVWDHVALVRRREALRPKRLAQSLVLYTADWIDPNFWSRKGFLLTLFSSVDTKVSDSVRAQLSPRVVAPDTSDAEPAEAIAEDPLYGVLERVASVFEASGKQVVWVAPPVTEQDAHKNAGPEFTRRYRSIADRFGMAFYDYADSGLPTPYFRDPSHLNARGRVAFSTVLARDLVPLFASSPVEDARSAGDASDAL